MKLSVRYVAAELARNYVIMAAALLVLFDLIGFLSESEDIGDGRYDLLDALIVITYSTPALLVDLSPFIVLLGTLAAFANLDSRTEITALRAAGASRTWFIRTAMMTSAAFMIFIAGVEGIARPAHLQASLLRMYETAKTGNPLKGTGFWTRAGTTYVNVQDIEDARRPGGIRIYELDATGRLTAYLFAKSATVVAPHQWRLEQVVDKTYTSGTPTAIDQRESVDWTPVWSSENTIYSLSVTSLSLADLIVSHTDRGDANVLAERVEFWRRLALPLSAIAYTALACAFALSARGRGGKSIRMAVGATAALLLYLAEQLTVNAGILAGVPIALVSFLPALLVFAAALALARRAP
jgi:lipopolysaccharide export system permease protein